MPKFQDKYVYTHNLPPTFWKRFIGINSIWPHGKVNLSSPLHTQSKYIPPPNLLMKFLICKYPFLTKLYIRQRSHYKPGFIPSPHRHMYLGYNSEHPLSLRNSTPNSQFLRLRRIQRSGYLQSRIHLYFHF